MLNLLSIYVLIATAFVVVKAQGNQICYNRTDEFSCVGQKNGAYLHNTSCTLYYDCYQEITTLCECLNDFLFDERYSGCNWNWDTDCGERERPTHLPTISTLPVTSPTTPGTGPTEEPFICPEPFGYFPDPNACHKFFYCSANNPSHYTCPAMLLWDTKESVCNHSGQVDCGDRPRP